MAIEIVESAKERWEAAERYAKELGGPSLESWERAVQFFEGFANRSKVRITGDSSPHSFNWYIEAIGCNGGLIFYGPSQSGSSGPQYSVSLSGDDFARWEINS